MKKMSMVNYTYLIFLGVMVIIGLLIYFNVGGLNDLW